MVVFITKDNFWSYVLWGAANCVRLELLYFEIGHTLLPLMLGMDLCLENVFLAMLTLPRRGKSALLLLRFQLTKPKVYDFYVTLMVYEDILWL